MAETADHSSPEEFKKHLGKYYVVFVALLCLTAITVGVSYLRLNRPLAIAVALVIATVRRAWWPASSCTSSPRRR